MLTYGDSMLVLSIFPGIGLLDRGFELEGFTTVRGPDPIWGGDIREFHPPVGKFDGIIGGPPCQSFSSLVHLVRANGHEPKFGNLIPEFERCVTEAQPDWFVMENVPVAPEPVVPGYGVTSFMLDNSMLDAGDGWGEEQRRVRRFSFGMRSVPNPPSLMRWIDLAVFVLPDAERKKAVFGDGRPTRQEVRNRVSTVCSTMGGKGGKLNFGTGGCYSLADACRLQGLPEDFLENAPFTKQGKLKAVANGVPIPMGRAIARAVREAVK